LKSANKTNFLLLRSPPRLMIFSILSLKIFAAWGVNLGLTPSRQAFENKILDFEELASLSGLLTKLLILGSDIGNSLSRKS